MFSNLRDTYSHNNSLKVLYIDKDETDILTAKKLLEVYFKNIKILNTTNQKLNNILNNDSFDFLIIDIDSPNIEVIDFINNIKHSSKDLNVIIFSKCENKDLLFEIMTLNPDAFILKPIVFNQFNNTIEKVMSHHTNKFLAKNDLYYINQYIKVIDNSTIISKTDLDGNITYVNDNFCKITGYSRNELIGNTHSLLKHKDNPDSLYSDMWKTIKTKKKEWHGILKNKSKSGRVYFIKCTIKPLFDLDGNVIEFIAFRDSVNVILDDKKHLLNKIELNNLSLLILEANVFST